MAITEQELKEIIGVKAEIEKITTLSSDGKNLLTRIPKEIRDSMKLEKGDKLRWVVDENKQISLEIIR
jgi:bifunctional DNA-binding transcriptional regulator/antitoxin component of YhaV-PrlF toxin-antitoxin module